MKSSLIPDRRYRWPSSAASSLLALLFVLPMLSLSIPAAQAKSRGWILTGDLNLPRASHTVTLLPDGRVLAVGGEMNFAPTATAEIYDPATGRWTLTGSMQQARYAHTATLLTDGRVLVAGGTTDAIGRLASAEIYDPATGNWTTTGRLAVGRYDFTATLLADGRVLVAGGLGVLQTEIYDPATGSWTSAGNIALSRTAATATLLPSGQVLLAGGYNNLRRGGPVASVLLYDPTAGVWTETGSMSSTRTTHTAALLPNGKVLVAGGIDNTGTALASAELYDPATETWMSTASLLTPHYGGRHGFVAQWQRPGDLRARCQRRHDGFGNLQSGDPNVVAFRQSDRCTGASRCSSFAERAGVGHGRQYVIACPFPDQRARAVTLRPDADRCALRRRAEPVGDDGRKAEPAMDAAAVRLAFFASKGRLV